jgi:hypothetical protein
MGIHYNTVSTGEITAGDKPGSRPKPCKPPHPMFHLPKLP